MSPVPKQINRYFDTVKTSNELNSKAGVSKPVKKAGKRDDWLLCILEFR